jgi:hypothetical protein
MCNLEHHMETVHADSSIQKSFHWMICQKSYPHDNTPSKHLKLKIHRCENRQVFN